MMSRNIRLLLSAFLVCVIAASCSDPVVEPDRKTFFRGKINGESFDANGIFLSCSRYSETIYTDNISGEVNGFHFEARNCDLGKEIEITIPENLHLGTFRGCGGNSDSDLALSVSYEDEYDNNCQDANLEITVIEIKDGFIYVEGHLDAKLTGTGFGDVTLSDGHFGVYEEER